MCHCFTDITTSMTEISQQGLKQWVMSMKKVILNSSMLFKFSITCTEICLVNDIQ